MEKLIQYDKPMRMIEREFPIGSVIVDGGISYRVKRFYYPRHKNDKPGIIVVSLSDERKNSNRKMMSRLTGVPEKYLPKF